MMAAIISPGQACSPNTEREKTPGWPEEIKRLRGVIDSRVPVSSCQHDQHTIPFFHLYPGNCSIESYVAARVLDGWIVAQDFLNDQGEQIGIGRKAAQRPPGVVRV